MFKDYDKYLSASLKVYLFVLVIIFILKLVGMDYFGLDINNPTILKINNFCLKYHLTDLWYVVDMWIYVYLILSITCKCNDKRMKLYATFCLPIVMFVNYMETHYSIMAINCIIDFIYLFILALIFNIKFNKIKKSNLLKNYIKIIVLNLLFQIVSVITRLGYFETNHYNFITNIILDLDYILLLIIYYKVYFEGGEKVCLATEVSLSLLKKINLKTLLKRLQRNLHNFRKLEKVEKLSIIIYLIFSLIWNTLSLVLILIVARLNDTFIECLFILTSFWLTKRTFGRAFHLSSMSKCFIVSNLTYYALNRLTTPLGISIFVPILLGVGLSYFTSKLVKKTYKPLYKGMPEDLFNETILKVTDKDSVKYKVCYDFYILRESDVSLSFKYNYTIAGIRKIKDRINDKIKELK